MANEFIPIAMAQLWQVTLLILVVAVLSRWLSRRRPHLSHLLWLVVLIKCVTPPVWASPGGVFCWLQPEQQIDTPFVEHVEWTPVAWDELLDIENTSTMDFETGNAPFAGVFLDEASEAELTAAPSVVEPPIDQPLGDRIGNAALVAWAVISGLVLLGVTIRWLRFWRLVRESPRRDSPELDAMLQTLSKQLGVRRRIRLIVTESLVGPAVVGFFRVTVLIPVVVADKLKGESVAPILAHELLHVRRGDLWVGLLQTVAQALWWFHPLVWWVGRVTSREAERCCDEEVLGELKCDPASYARALLDVLDLKSQLKPVPVFPGVRPVDVTSQRLERIMTLRQGCRRRSPWWCWLVAIGAAALTLPGAAFVVTAQEEESAEPTTNEESSALPAPPAYVGPGPFSPMPLPQDTELTAYAFGKGNDTPITEVYDITEFIPLLSGSESEQQRKFERLVKSRDPAHDAQVNWFNGQPVVKTTAAGHAAVRQCIDIFVGSGATSETIDAFVGSVSTQLDETLICDLQVISVSDDAYGKLENVATDLSDETPWVIPADKWEQAVRSINRDETFLFLAPKCAVLNGRSVMVESISEHPVSLKREDDGSLVPGVNWSGWKTQLLPFVRDDGSFWLGLSFENGKVVGTNTLSAKQAKQIKAEGPATVHAYRQREFSTTLKEGQIVVLPGFEIAHGDDAPRATLMTARVRRLSNRPSTNAMPSPRRVRGTSLKSDAGVEGELALDPQADLKRTSPQPLVAASSEERPGTMHPLGPVTLRIAQRNDKSKPRKLMLSLESNTGLGVMAGTTETFQIQKRGEITTACFTAVRLTIPAPKGRHLIIAQEACITCEMIPAEKAASLVGLQLKSAQIQMGGKQSNSRLDADRVNLMLNVRTLDIENLEADGLGSLQVNPELSDDVVRLRNAASAKQLLEEVEEELELIEWVQREEIWRREVDRFEKQLHEEFPKCGVFLIPLQQRIIVKGQASDAKTNKEIMGRVKAFLARHPVAKPPANVDVNLSEGHASSEKLNETIINLLDVEVPQPKIETIGFKLVAAAYPVANLVVPIPDTVNFRFDTDRMLSEQSPRDKSDHKLEFEKLVTLIRQTVEPDSWQEAGGWGTIRENEKTLSLVIRQTQDVHRQVSDLLDQLRRLQDIQVSLRMQTLELSQEFFADWKSDLVFEPLSDSTHRYMRLSSAEADEVRKAGNASLVPKVTLFNGQLCELRMNEQDGMKLSWHVQPVVSGDRRSVRLGIGIDDGRSGAAGKAVPTSVTTVSDGDAILVEVNGSTEKERRIVGEPIPGRPRAFRRVSQPRRFVLIQPEVVVVEEEEELLGIDVGK